MSFFYYETYQVGGCIYRLVSVVSYEGSNAGDFVNV